MNRKQILDDAANAVLRDRSATHGKPENSFGDIAKLWGAFLDRELEPWQVAIMLGLLKVARAKGNPTNPDNWADMAGYAACGGELAKPDGLVVNSIDGSQIISAKMNGKVPNVIIVHYGEMEWQEVICKDEDDVKKNGLIPYHLYLGDVDCREDAIEKGNELLMSKSILVNV